MASGDRRSFLKREMLYLALGLSILVPAAFGGDCGCGGNVAVRIIDGKAAPISDFPTVGKLGDSKGGFYCTASLIAPHFVLSAAHCVVDRVGKPAFGQTEGRFLLNGQVYNSVHVYIHPTYLGDASQEMEGAIDVSIFELDRDVPNVVPSPLMRRPPIPGFWMTLIGFGELGTGAKGINGTFPAMGTLTVGRTPLDILTDTFTKWRFESKPSPNEESNTAPGDSGGPQFMTIDGVTAIASITSGGRKPSAGWGDVSYNTRVDVAAPWIDSIVGGTAVPGNNPPTVQSFTADSQNPSAMQAVTFSMAATDPDGDTLNYHWSFGDGLEDIHGSANESHTYPLDGTFTVQCIVTDGRGGSVEQQMTLKVGSGITVIPVVESTVIKKKFSVNFNTPARNSIQFSLSNPKLMYASRTDFINAVNGSIIKVFIDVTQIDSLTVVSGRPFGSGSLSLSFKTGTVTYQIRTLPSLTNLLAPFGVSSSTTSATVTVPLRVQVLGNRFGGDGVFQYTGTAKSGTGK